MTTHPRQQIRHAITNRLGDVVNPLAQPDAQIYWTPCADRVYASRSREVTPADLPLIIVNTLEESVEPINVSGWEGGYRRTLTVAIEGLAEALEHVEDELDAIAVGVEGGLDGLVITNAEQSMLRLKSTEMDVDREGDIPIGAVRLTYECIYTTQHLGVDLGLWDRDGACIANPGVSVQQITIRNNFGTETYEV